LNCFLSDLFVCLLFAFWFVFACLLFVFFLCLFLVQPFSVLPVRVLFIYILRPVVFCLGNKNKNKIKLKGTVIELPL